MRWKTWAALALWAAAVWPAHAQPAMTTAMGLDVIETETDGPITLFYPSATAAQPVKRGPFELHVAWQGAPQRGNGRLIVISHGSGGAPWVHTDLARALVLAGYVVALPEHRGDNWRDTADAGPVTWQRRPVEVSRAVDAVAASARFAPLLRLDRVGVFGQSSGGHTGLSMAGGAWSPGRFRRYCEQHMADDFQACVGLFTQLTGGWLDGTKLRVARWVLNARFDDDTPRTHHDARIAAVVVGVPYAADFDLATLAQPRVPLGLVLAGQDRWLQPRFHGERLKAACRACELLAELPGAGHSVMLSPLPPGLTGLAADLLSDPPGFDRERVVPMLNERIVGFFHRHLPAP